MVINIIKKISTITIALIILLSALFILIPEHTKADGEGWLLQYNNRLKHTITGKAGAGTDYQIGLVIHSGTGSNSGNTCYLQNTCNDFPNDIRFTDNDGTTELSYFIEDETSDPIRTWIKVNDNLNTDQSIYIYTNNSIITETNSNGTATFDWFFDFRVRHDPAYLDVKANIGDTWIDVENVSAFRVGDTVVIYDKTRDDYAQGGIRGDSAENITITEIHEGNTTLKISSPLTDEYFTGSDALVSYWHRHNVYDGGWDYTYRFYYELSNVTPDDIRSLYGCVLTDYDLGQQATVGIGLDRLLLNDEEAVESDCIYTRFHNKGNMNATSQHAGVDFYACEDGFEDQDGDLAIVFSNDDEPPFGLGDTLVVEHLADGGASRAYQYMHQDGQTYFINMSDLNDGNCSGQFGTNAPQYPDDLNFPFFRVHPDTGSTVPYDINYDETYKGMSVYTRNSNGDVVEVTTLWWGVGKYVNPEPISSTWHTPEFNSEAIEIQSINNQANNTYVTVATRTFNWTKITSPYLTGYNLQISNTTDFASPFLNLDNINATNYAGGGYYTESASYVEFILPPAYNIQWEGTHYYRVRGKFYGR